MVMTNTVRGPIDVSELGFTLMHEHIVLQSPAAQLNWPSILDRERAKRHAIQKLMQAKAAGVNTLVDMTTADNGRDIHLIAEIAREVDLHVIVATGLWLQVPRSFNMSSPDAVADLFVRDIAQGIQGTQIKASIIKNASDEPELSGVQEMAFRAGARAALRTGAALSTHSSAARCGGLDHLRVYAEEGVDLGRVIVGHSGDTEDVDYLKRIVDRGACLGMDRFGLTHFGAQRFLTTEQRVAVVARLCRDGYAAQIVLSHDTSAWPDGRTVEFQNETWPDWHHAHIPRDVIPALLQAGVSQRAIDQMTRDNPRALLGLTPARATAHQVKQPQAVT